jgi:hypothetical protein
MEKKKNGYAKRQWSFMYELAKKIRHKLQLTEKKMCNQITDWVHEEAPVSL